MIKWIVISLIGLIILGYLGFDVRKAIDAPVTQTNLQYAKEIVVNVWNKYLKNLTTYLWKEVFIKYIWEPAFNILKEKVGKDNKEETSVHSTGRFFYTFSLPMYC